MFFSGKNVCVELINLFFLINNPPSRKKIVFQRLFFIKNKKIKDNDNKMT